MRRIGIQWNSDGMLGDTLQGTVTMMEGKTTITMSLVGSIQVEMSKSSVHIKGIDGNSLPKAYEKYSDLIYAMIKCYRAGLTHAEELYHWIEL